MPSPAASPALVLRAEPIAAIHALRGLSAVYVALYHLSAVSAATWFTRFGYVGVDVFFIVSGFIIYQSTGAQEDAASFGIRRLFRLLPPLWVATAGAIVLADRVPDLAELAQSAVLIPRLNGDQPFFGGGLLTVAWTLSYELAFYLIFCAVLLVPAARRRRGLAVSAAIVAICCGLQLAVAGRVTLDPHNAPVVPLPLGQVLSIFANPLMLEFVVGIALAAGYRALMPALHARARLLTALLLLLAPVVVAGILTPSIFNHGLTGKGAVAALIVLYALLLEGKRPAFLARWPLRLLGNISYSFYLLHMIATPLARRAIPAFENYCVFITDPWHAIAINLAVALLAAIVFYLLVERPAQRAGRGLARALARWRAQRSTASQACSSCSTMLPPLPRPP